MCRHCHANSPLPQLSTSHQELPTRTHPDHCSDRLAGCTKQTLDKLQRVLNCSARVIFGGDSRHHVTQLLHDHLHWLRARERISFKLCILVYKAIHGLAPCYLNEMCTPVSTVPNLSVLRSASRGDLVIPRTRLKLGNHAFCVAGPVAWNSLPLDIRLAPTLSTFKNMLKTSVLSFLLHSRTVSRAGAVNFVQCPCSDFSYVTAPYKLWFYYYYYYYY